MFLVWSSAEGSLVRALHNADVTHLTQGARSTLALNKLCKQLNNPHSHLTAHIHTYTNVTTASAGPRLHTSSEHAECLHCF